MVTYESDVYSFGVVVWEVVTTELPWAKATGPLEVLCAVLRGDRPEFPAYAHAGIADITRRCWAKEQRDRPKFTSLVQELKSIGWDEQVW